MRKGRIIVVLPSAKLILSVEGGKFTSGGIFLTKSNQFITKNFWLELLVVTKEYPEYVGHFLLEFLIRR